METCKRAMSECRLIRWSKLLSYGRPRTTSRRLAVISRASGRYFLAFPNWPADGLFWSSGGSGTAAGTNTYSATIAGVTSYRAGQFFYITFTNAATGASTLNINGIGAVTLTDRTHVTAGSSWFVQYDGTQFLIMGGITRVFVYTMTAIGQVGAWSHGLLQFTLEDFCSGRQ